MNKQQVSYLKKRIETVRDQKIKDAEIAYHEIDRKHSRARLSTEQKLDLIYTGKVKLKPRKENSSRYSCYLTDAFDFPQDKEQGESQKADRLKHEARIDKLNREATRIIDTAVFKDAEDAIAMLASFDKF